MTEIAVTPPARTRVRALQLAAVAVASALIAIGIGGLHAQRVNEPVAAPHVQRLVREHPVHRHAAAPVPVRVHRAHVRHVSFVRPASLAFDRDLLVSSSGTFTIARRVAGLRHLVLRAARREHVDPNVLEAMVFLQRQQHPRRARFLAGRHPVGPALLATAHTLAVARRRLGRMDLAVASTALGVRTLRRATHGRRIPFGQLYFGAAPDRDRGVWLRLNSRGAAARDYYWRVLAAERVLSLWRHRPAELAYEQVLQFRKNSAEEVLHPLAVTHRFATPSALRRAWHRHALVAIPRNASRTHVALAGSFGQMAYRLGRSRKLYRGLRPDALAVLLQLGKRVHELSGAHRPLYVTSAVRDLRYQRVLLNHNAMAARSYSLHTTGYAFDIARSYGSLREARAFQFELDRLQALHLIAYIREPAAIHIAVAAHAAARLRALRGDL
jgi:hypothetical protein